MERRRQPQREKSSHTLDLYQKSIADGYHPGRPEELQAEYCRARADGNTAAIDQIKQELVECHQRFILKMANYYSRTTGMPVLDLIDEGNLGALRAAEKFDPNQPATFLTYASHWIRAFMLNYINKEREGGIHISGHAQEKARLLWSIFRDLAKKLERRPTTEELVKASGMSKENVILYLHPPTRVSENVYGQADGPDDRPPFVEGLSDPHAATPEKIVLQKLEVEALRAAVDAVIKNERERLVINQRYLTADPKTLKEIGIELSLTRERVRQIEVKALKRLRLYLQRQERNVPTPENK